MKMYTHGDVLINSVVSVPKEAKEIKCNGVAVLAEGEVTGHAHRIKSPHVTMYEYKGIKYVKVDHDAPLTHEEHKEIVLPKGAYEVRIAQEYDHFAEEAREVAD